MSQQFEQAKVHIDRGEIDQAITCLIDHLDTEFYDEIALLMLGGCFIQKNKPGIAAAITREALNIRAKKGKNFPEALQNLGAAFKCVNKMEDAAQVWNLALEVETDPFERAKILSNLGGAFVCNGTPETALVYYTHGLELRPDMASIQFNRSFPNLELGNWEQGWRDFHCGFKSGDRKSRFYRDIPEWTGKRNQTVIVWGEQGVGDEILFASCLPDMIRHSKKVILDCHPRLVELFKRSFPTIEIHGTRKTLSELKWLDEVEADGSVCISALPMYFRNQDKDFPGKPFLKAADIFAQGNRKRVGLAWLGGTQRTRSDLRSFPLKTLLPILEANPAVEFYSLQYTPDAAREVCELEEQTGIRVRHYPGWVECRDYDRTASFVKQLDLTLTVCTAIHHLSNAIGVPTWTLVPSKPAWRYANRGELWYKETSTFFRQKDGESWDAVISRVGESFADYAGISKPERAVA